MGSTYKFQYTVLNQRLTEIEANIEANADGIASNTEAIEILEGMALNRFTDMGDGTIRDNYSNLFWLKDANCSEFLDGGKGLTWETASDAVANLADGTCGLTDKSMAGEWRLPTLEEWGNFMSHEFAPPALANTVGDGPWQEGDAFTGGTLYEYWSSSAGGAYLRYTVDMDQGIPIQRPMEQTHFVWPVRNR